MVNSGIINLIPEGKRYNMTDLILEVINLDKKILVFNIKGK